MGYKLKNKGAMDSLLAVKSFLKNNDWDIQLTKIVLAEKNGSVIFNSKAKIIIRTQSKLL